MKRRKFKHIIAAHTRVLARIDARPRGETWERAYRRMLSEEYAAADTNKKAPPVANRPYQQLGGVGERHED